MGEEKTSRLLSMIGRCLDEGRANFESVAESISSAAEEDVEGVTRDTSAQVKRARQEADDAIRRIMHERDARIRDINNKADLKNRAIKARKEALLSEIQRFRRDFEGKIKDKRSRVEGHLRVRPAARSDLTSVEVTEASDHDGLRAGAQECLESARRITAACKKIKFHRQNTDSEDLLGTLKGVKHSWELKTTVKIPPSVVYPELLASAKGSNNIVMTNETRTSVFEMNLDTQRTRTVVKDTQFDICDCACVGDSIAVTDYNSKTVHVYDGAAGNIVKTMNVPSACSRISTTKDGLLLVGDELSRKIYFLSPRNGKIIRTMPIEGNKINGIFVMSRGWIVIQTGITTISVYDELGVLKETIQDSAWSELRCAVHRDVIFIMYKKMDDITTYVAIRAPNGRPEDIFSCRISKFLLTEFLVTSSGNIAINGDNEILIYGQAPGFEEIIKSLK